ncbi:MAG TPA: hypothetical protein VGV65_03790, partial [Nocardioides sp.]|nr:hypothetical protein [Nocardioides sp.]
LPNPASRHRHLALLFATCLAVVLGLAVVNPAVAGKPSGGGTVLPTPTRIVVTGVTSDFTRSDVFEDLDGALPTVVVQAGGTLTVDVRFEDANGAAAAFKKDTTLRVTTNVGTLSSTTGKALKGQPTARITTSVTSVVNQVALTVAAPSAAPVPAPGSSVTFDVLSEIKPNVPASSGSAFAAGIGGNAGCVSAEPATPVCGIVQLPRGSSNNVLLSVGACDTDPAAVYAPCYQGPNGPGGAVVQSLFTQPAVPYSTSSPATVILKCDKTLCGTGSIRGLTVLYSLKGNDPLAAPGACPAKGVMAEAGKACIDYVQSKRDGSGDTHLFLLTDRDIRTGIG